MTSVQEEAPQLAAPAAALPLQPDAEIDAETDISDGDSALGASIASSTTSLASSVCAYVYENGRRYHAFNEGEYMLPNDEREQDRMDLQHHVFRLILAGRLHRAPLSPATTRRVLDIGTGTGIWAIDFADEYPDAKVIGNDLSPIQPSWVPPNCKFVVDDVENEWVYAPEDAFDFIHGRALGGSIRDWDPLYRRIHAHLAPGGWAEMHEYEGWLMSDDDPELKKVPSIARWMGLIDEASATFGKKINMAATIKQRFLDAGFENVQDDVYKVPVGTWPLDPKLKNLGLYQLEQMCESVEPFTLALLTRILGWTNEETQVLMANVRKEFRDKKNHLYGVFHFVYGQKPLKA